MWGLIANEYRKLFARKGTKFNLILCFILVLMFAVVVNKMADIKEVVDKESFSENELNRLISEYKQSSILEERKEAKAFEYLKENKIYNYSSWKGEAVRYAYTNCGEDNDFSALINSLKDWHQYYELRIKEIDNDDTLTKEQKIVQKYKYEAGLKYNVEPDSNNWKEKVIKNNGYLLQNLLNIENTKNKNALKEKIKIGSYCLDNNISVIANFDNRYLYNNINFYTSFSGYRAENFIICLIIVIFTSYIVCKEFQQGTIQMLFLQPVSRKKIWMSKYLCLISLTGMMTAGVWITKLIVSIGFYGIQGIDAPYLFVNHGNVQQSSGMLYVGLSWLLHMAEPIIFTSIAFLITTCVINETITTIINIFIMLFSKTTVSAAAMLPIGNLYLFTNIDLFSIYEGSTNITNQSLSMAVLVDIIYIIAIIWVSIHVINKKQLY